MLLMTKFKILFVFITQVIISDVYSFTSSKLLLTGGVSQIEGAAGGGLTPWALIGSYASRDEIGANAFSTVTRTQNYSLKAQGLLIGFYNRLELSFSNQVFNTEKVGEELGLGHSFKIHQQSIGLKLKVIGDAVYKQDSFLPQISVGVLNKENKEEVVKNFGAEDIRGSDYYLAMTKILLKYGMIYNVTFRWTKANQLGILGFGGDKNSDENLMFEGSLGYLINRRLLFGVEYRQKPDNLKIAQEDAWTDIFLAWAPSKNISLTLAYVDLGNIVTHDNQSGVYSSLQVGF